MENNLISKITKFIKKDNNLQLAIVAVAVVALIAFLVTTSFAKGTQPQADGGNGTQASQSNMEEDL